MTGETVSGGSVRLALPDGRYTLTFRNPADASLIETRSVVSQGASKTPSIPLPEFKDDLVLIVDRVETQQRTVIPGTQ
jgi:hypothetical protein